MTNAENMERPGPLSRPPARRRWVLAGALVAACALGAGAGALAEHGRRPVMVALAPAPIVGMKDWSQVAVKGQVAEVFGNAFILADASGRALIDTGPGGDGGQLVAKDETVTVQGRFERGSVRAVALQFGDGRTVMVGPPGPPHPPLWPRP